MSSYDYSTRHIHRFLSAEKQKIFRKSEEKFRQNKRLKLSDEHRTTHNSDEASNSSVADEKSLFDSSFQASDSESLIAIDDDKCCYEDKHISETDEATDSDGMLDDYDAMNVDDDIINDDDAMNVDDITDADDTTDLDDTTYADDTTDADSTTSDVSEWESSVVYDLEAYQDESSKTENRNILESKSPNAKSPSRRTCMLQKLELEEENFSDGDKGDECPDTTPERKSKEERNRDQEFVEDIRQVFLRNISSVKNTVINEVLGVLRKHTDAPFPQDARTLLKTPRTTDVTSMSGGQYYHRGIKTAVTEFYSNYRKNNLDVNAIEIVAMIDGADLAKSSENSLWLILCAETLLDDVALVGAYYGEGKPESSDKFLHPFIEELKHLIQYGLVIDDVNITVSLKVFIYFKQQHLRAKKYFEIIPRKI